MVRATIAGVVLLAARLVTAGDPQPPRDLTELTLAELAEIEVTTLARRPQRADDVPAAVQVITGQDIRRQGVTTLVQALRLAPGIQVAQIDGSKFAVGIRGFPGRLSRAMLVLVDGRSVYDPLFAGTLWETPDVVLDDVERIEVIRGPGGALWGANAVTGIVNIITRPAKDTPSGLVRVRLGNAERQLNARVAGSAGPELHARAWTKLYDREGGRNDLFPEGFDDARVGRLGARADWTPGAWDTFTLDGALYRGDLGQVVPVLTYEPPSQGPVLHDARIDGGHLLAQWRRRDAAGPATSVTAYFDAADREEAHFDESRRTLDVEATHTRRLGSRHELVAGAGVRRADIGTDGTDGASFDPADRVDTIVSAFAQHETQLLAGRVRLSAGAKLERNPYSDWELQPSARLLVHAAAGHTAWASVARAVRTPSRTERDVALTSLVDAGTRTFTRIVGTDTFMSEVVDAVEAGWRAHLLDGRLGLDVTAFANRYDHLLGLAPGAPFTEGEPRRTVIPVEIRNLMDGQTRGLEASARVQVAGRGGLQGSWSLLDVDLEPEDPAGDRTLEAVEGYSPRHRIHVLAWLELPRGAELSGTLRRHSDLPGLGVPGYVELDARGSWTRGDLELALVGRNLLHRDHVEWQEGAQGATAIRRAFFAQASLRW